jgi:hypothetical protein
MSPDGPTTKMESSSHDNAPYVKLPKLSPNGDNWVLWKAEVTSAVRSKGLARFLEGRAKAPTKPQAPTDPALLEAYEKTVETHEEAHDLWVQRNEKIKTVFYQTIPANLKFGVMRASTAAEAWTFLCNEFENTGALSQVNILDEINTLHTDEGGDPRIMLDRLEELKEKYANAGGLLDESNEIAAMIRLLPPEYRTSIRSLLASAGRDKKPLKAKELSSIIRSIARDDSSLNNRATKTEAYSAHVRNSKPNNPRSNRNKSNDVCSNCNKKGHWRQDCWSKGGGKAGQRPSNWKDIVGSSRNNSANQTKEAATVASTADATTTEFAYLVQTDFAKVEAAKLARESHRRILDSGASRHFEPDRTKFATYHSISPRPMTSADGRNFYANGEGDVPIEIPREGGPVCITLHNVLHAAEMPIGLVSVSAMARSGYKANFDEKGCQIYAPDGQYVATVTPMNGLYPIGTQPTPAPLPPSSAMKASVTKLSLLELHRRMGHAHAAELRRMVSSGIVTGIELSETDMPTCETCIASKHAETSFPSKRSSPPATRYGELVHCDVWGPASTKTFGGKQYYCSHIDDYSDECVLVLLKTKDEVFKSYKDYEAWAKRHRGVTAIGSHQSDRGGEYMDSNFLSHLQSQGTVIRRTVHDSPSQNGKAERLNRTIPEHARAMRIEARLPKALWGEATMHAVWL